VRLHERLALDARLPQRFRGRDGAEALVREVPLRVAVTGVDHAFDLVRMVHEALARRGRRVFSRAGLRHDEAAHGPRRPAADTRLLWQAKKAWPMDALLLESPADGADGLAFHRNVAQAQIVLLTGLAQDPRHGAHEPDAARARAVAAALPEKATLVSGERDPGLRAALREGVREAGGFLVDAAPRSAKAPPGLEAITVLDRFLRIRVGEGLSPAEKVRLLARLQRRLQWSPSALAGVRWHDGTGLGPTGLRSTLDHLLSRWPVRSHLLAYFGDGKGDDAARFEPVLDRALADGAIAHAYVAGRGSKGLARSLGNHHGVTFIQPKPSALPGLLRMLRSECHAGAVVTAGDGGAPWMRDLTSALRLPGLRRGAWAPFGAHASDLPTPIAPWRPPTAAPGYGRRSSASVFGDLEAAAAKPAPAKGWQAPSPPSAPAAGASPPGQPG
jgi:hypothetical protein